MYGYLLSGGEAPDVGGVEARWEGGAPVNTAPSARAGGAELGEQGAEAVHRAAAQTEGRPSRTRSKGEATPARARALRAEGRRHRRKASSFTVRYIALQASEEYRGRWETAYLCDSGVCLCLCRSMVWSAELRSETLSAPPHSRGHHQI
jgi:hypothetical protein